MKLVHIHIGDIFASREPAEVETVLGSCIAVCLFDPVALVGGMNHFMLPEGQPDDPVPTRFGMHAMGALVDQIHLMGGQKARLQAKIFGAASVLEMDETWICVPSANREFARRYLAAENIPLVSERLGGRLPLKIRLFTQTGKVLVRALPRNRATALIGREQECREIALAARWKWFEQLGDTSRGEPSP